MDMTLVAQTASAFSALRTIASGLIELRDFNKLAAVQADMNRELLTAQNGLFDLQAKLLALSDALNAEKAAHAELKARASERERYALHEVEPGRFVYKRRADVEPTEPAHYLCQPCFDKGVKAVLQETHDKYRDEIKCPVCKLAAVHHNHPIYHPPQGRDDPFS